METSNAINALSLADLDTYDGQAGRSGAKRRYLCPWCGDNKPRDTEHRSLSANTVTGAWKCWRCKVTGKLKDRWTDRLPIAPRDARRARLRQAFELQLVVPSPTPHEGDKWRCQLNGLMKLGDTLGAVYLNERGINVEVAALAGVRYSSRWYGRQAVVFPIRNQIGDLVAAQGRAINSADKLTAGPKSQGIFTAHSFIAGQFFHAIDPRLEALILTEAPIDALSLAVCGFPAIALCGASGPKWLHRVCGLRRVVLATDSDQASEKAAIDITAQLDPFGARCERLRPDGAKDWNALLLRIGRDALSDWLALRVL